MLHKCLIYLSTIFAFQTCSLIRIFIYTDNGDFDQYWSYVYKSSPFFCAVEMINIPTVERTVAKQNVFITKVQCSEMALRPLVIVLIRRFSS